MSRLTDNDRNYGPITIARWKNRFEFTFNSGGGYDDAPRNHFLFVAFGWALRIYVPTIIQPYSERYDTHNREYGIILTQSGDSYDFFQIHFGPQTHDSRTTKGWSKFLPWTQWDMVRHSIYTPNGTLLATKDRQKWDEWYRLTEECPKVHFGFEDYDGEMIIATCYMEEREWRKGDGWFKWLRWFSKPLIRRDLNLSFDHEVGPEKGSWKGGTVGHSVDMLPHEDPEMVFRRYCSKEHERKGRTFKLRFIGPCGPPEPREIRVARNRGWVEAKHPQDATKSQWFHKECPLCPDGKYISTEEMLEYIKAERDRNNAGVDAECAIKP